MRLEFGGGAGAGVTTCSGTKILAVAMLLPGPGCRSTAPKPAPVTFERGPLLGDQIVTVAPEPAVVEAWIAAEKRERFEWSPNARVSDGRAVTELEFRRCRSRLLIECVSNEIRGTPLCVAHSLEARGYYGEPDHIATSDGDDSIERWRYELAEYLVELTFANGARHTCMVKRRSL